MVLLTGWRTRVAWFWRLATVVLILMNLRAAPVRSQHAGTTNVLFIGHSWMSGVADHINEMTVPTNDFWADEVTQGGTELKDFWLDPNLYNSIVSKLQTGQFDYAVMIEHPTIAYTDLDQYLQYASLLDGLFNSYGVETVLALPWWWNGFPDMLDTLTDNTYYVAGQIGATVAPVGQAFKTSLALRPDLEIFKPDSHPTTFGIYLRDCVFYSTIMQQNPQNLANPHDGGGEWYINPTDEIHYKTVAWDTVLEWNDGIRPDVYFNPPSKGVAMSATNQTYEIFLDTNSFEVTDVVIEVSYDQQVLQITAIEAGDALPVLVQSNITGSTATITVSHQSSFNGTGKVASITFDAASTPAVTSIPFTTNATVTAVGNQGNMLGQATDGTVVIGYQSFLPLTLSD